MSGSIIYHHVALYRLMMRALYRGQYRERFKQVCALIRESDGTVLELCFGDVAIATYCRKHGQRWTGLDVSDAFVKYAVKRGFDARKQNLLAEAGPLPSCDVCIMMGSLYHFKARLPDLFRRMKGASSRVVVSEPVVNWTHSGAVLRFLANVLTRTDAQEETFRFNEASLIKTLDELKALVGFDYRVVSVARDMVVEVVWSS